MDGYVDVLVRPCQIGQGALEQRGGLVPVPRAVVSEDVDERLVDGRGGDEARAAVECLDELRHLVPCGHGLQLEAHRNESISSHRSRMVSSPIP